MQEKLVAIKGINDGLLVTLDQSEQWQSLTTMLATRIDRQAALFAGAKITVAVGARPVPKYDLRSLKALLERRGLSLHLVLSESDTTRKSAAALHLPVRAQLSGGRTTQRPSTGPVASYSSEETGTDGTLFRRTLRSGRTMHSEGHIVIIGDVNPGAKVVAAGDIIVWGALRGFAHAGAVGNAAAIVCALEMRPSQLRIAGYVADIAPVRGEPGRQVIAQVQGRRIVLQAKT